MTKGIYCYIDKTNNEIVYVGKDSNIHKNKRRNAHKQPKRYNDQQINRIIQNNPFRYQYKILWETNDCSNNHLNQMEIYYISKYNPIFNFTNGGDGASGFKHTEEFKAYRSALYKGKNNPNYKNFARVIKAGIVDDKQRYLLMNQLIKVGMSFDKDLLETLAYQLNQKEISTDEAKNIIQTHYIKRGAQHPQYKDYARIVKGGDKYSIMYESRRLCSSADKSLLEDLANKINVKQISVNDVKSEMQKKQDDARISRNTTGFFRVSKRKNKAYKKGFVWRYRYLNEHHKEKALTATSLDSLKQKVLRKNLEWKIIDEEKAQRSLDLDKRGIL